MKSPENSFSAYAVSCVFECDVLVYNNVNATYKLICINNIQYFLNIVCTPLYNTLGFHSVDSYTYIVWLDTPTQ